MRPILALNCLLQIEQERSEEESSVGDALALAFRCARFCSASLIFFASYSPAPLFMRPRHFVRSCAICNNPKYYDIHAHAYSIDPDQIMQNATSDLGLDCLLHIQQYFSHNNKQ